MWSYNKITVLSQLP